MKRFIRWLHQYIGGYYIKHYVLTQSGPKVDGNEGRTPALGDHQARKLLDAPDGASSD
ncbi:MAG: hypothetical protein WAW61_05415 [Methylococcaceae bacterium]